MSWSLCRFLRSWIFWLLLMVFCCVCLVVIVGSLWFVVVRCMFVCCRLCLICLVVVVKCLLWRR